MAVGAVLVRGLSATTTLARVGQNGDRTRQRIGETESRRRRNRACWPAPCSASRRLETFVVSAPVATLIRRRPADEHRERDFGELQTLTSIRSCRRHSKAPGRSREFWYEPWIRERAGLPARIPGIPVPRASVVFVLDIHVAELNFSLSEQQFRMLGDLSRLPDDPEQQRGEPDAESSPGEKQLSVTAESPPAERRGDVPMQRGKSWRTWAYDLVMGDEESAKESDTAIVNEILEHARSPGDSERDSRKDTSPSGSGRDAKGSTVVGAVSVDRIKLVLLLHSGARSNVRGSTRTPQGADTDSASEVSSASSRMIVTASSSPIASGSSVQAPLGWGPVAHGRSTNSTSTSGSAAKLLRIAEIEVQRIVTEIRVTQGPCSCFPSMELHSDVETIDFRRWERPTPDSSDAAPATDIFVWGLLDNDTGSAPHPYHAWSLFGGGLGADRYRGSGREYFVAASAPKRRANDANEGEADDDHGDSDGDDDDVDESEHESNALPRGRQWRVVRALRLRAIAPLTPVNGLSTTTPQTSLYPAVVDLGVGPMCGCLDACTVEFLGQFLGVAGSASSDVSADDPPRDAPANGLALSGSTSVFTVAGDSASLPIRPLDLLATCAHVELSFSARMLPRPGSPHPSTTLVGVGQRVTANDVLPPPQRTLQGQEAAVERLRTASGVRARVPCVTLLVHHAIFRFGKELHLALPLNNVRANVLIPGMDSTLGSKETQQFAHLSPGQMPAMADTDCPSRKARAHAHNSTIALGLSAQALRILSGLHPVPSRADLFHVLRKATLGPAASATALPQVGAPAHLGEIAVFTRLACSLDQRDTIVCDSRAVLGELQIRLSFPLVHNVLQTVTGILAPLNLSGFQLGEPLSSLVSPLAGSAAVAPIPFSDSSVFTCAFGDLQVSAQARHTAVSLAACVGHVEARLGGHAVISAEPPALRGDKDLFSVAFRATHLHPNLVSGLVETKRLGTAIDISDSQVCLGLRCSSATVDWTTVVNLFAWRSALLREFAPWAGVLFTSGPMQVPTSEGGAPRRAVLDRITAMLDVEVEPWTVQMMGRRGPEPGPGLGPAAASASEAQFRLPLLSVRTSHRAPVSPKGGPTPSHTAYARAMRCQLDNLYVEWAATGGRLTTIANARARPRAVIPNLTCDGTVHVLRSSSAAAPHTSATRSLAVHAHVHAWQLSLDYEQTSILSRALDHALDTHLGAQENSRVSAPTKLDRGPLRDEPMAVTFTLACDSLSVSLHPSSLPSSFGAHLGEALDGTVYHVPITVHIEMDTLEALFAVDASAHQTRVRVSKISLQDLRVEETIRSAAGMQGLQAVSSNVHTTAAEHQDDTVGAILRRHPRVLERVLANAAMREAGALACAVGFTLGKPQLSKPHLVSVSWPARSAKAVHRQSPPPVTSGVTEPHHGTTSRAPRSPIFVAASGMSAGASNGSRAEPFARFQAEHDSAGAYVVHARILPFDLILRGPAVFGCAALLSLLFRDGRGGLAPQPLGHPSLRAEGLDATWQIPVVDIGIGRVRLFMPTSAPFPGIRKPRAHVHVHGTDIGGLRNGTGPLARNPELLVGEGGALLFDVSGGLSVKTRNAPDGTTCFATVGPALLACGAWFTATPGSEHAESHLQVNPSNVVERTHIHSGHAAAVFASECVSRDLGLSATAVATRAGRSLDLSVAINEVNCVLSCAAFAVLQSAMDAFFSTPVLFRTARFASARASVAHAQERHSLPVQSTGIGLGDSADRTALAAPPRTWHVFVSLPLLRIALVPETGTDERNPCPPLMDFSMQNFNLEHGHGGGHVTFADIALSVNPDGVERACVLTDGEIGAHWTSDALGPIFSVESKQRLQLYFDRPAVGRVLDFVFAVPVPSQVHEALIRARAVVRRMNADLLGRASPWPKRQPRGKLVLPGALCAFATSLGGPAAVIFLSEAFVSVDHDRGSVEKQVSYLDAGRRGTSDGSGPQVVDADPEAVAHGGGGEPSRAKPLPEKYTSARTIDVTLIGFQLLLPLRHDSPFRERRISLSGFGPQDVCMPAIDWRVAGTYVEEPYQLALHYEAPVVSLALSADHIAVLHLVLKSFAFATSHAYEEDLKQRRRRRRVRREAEGFLQEHSSMKNESAFTASSDTSPVMASPRQATRSPLPPMTPLGAPVAAAEPQTDELAAECFARVLDRRLLPAPLQIAFTDQVHRDLPCLGEKASRGPESGSVDRLHDVTVAQRTDLLYNEDFASRTADHHHYGGLSYTPRGPANLESQANASAPWSAREWVGFRWRFSEPRIVTSLHVAPVSLAAVLKDRAFGPRARDACCQLLCWDSVREVYVLVVEFFAALTSSDASDVPGEVARSSAFTSWVDVALDAARGPAASMSDPDVVRDASADTGASWLHRADGPDGSAQSHGDDRVHIRVPVAGSLDASDLWMVRWEIPETSALGYLEGEEHDLETRTMEQHQRLAVSNALASCVTLHSEHMAGYLPYFDISFEMQRFDVRFLHYCSQTPSRRAPPPRRLPVEPLAVWRTEDFSLKVRQWAGRVLKDGTLLLRTLVYAQSRLAIDVQDFRTFDTVGLLSPSQVAVEVLIGEFGKRAIDIRAESLRWNLSPFSVVAAQHATLGFLQDLGDRAERAQELAPSLTPGGAGSRADPGSTSTTARALGPEPTSQQGGACLRYVILNRAGRHLWVGQHATREQLCIAPGSAEPYSWLACNCASPPSSNRRLRFALGGGADGSGEPNVWSEPLDVEAAGVYVRTLQLSTSSEASRPSGFLRSGDSAVLYVSVERGATPLQTVITLHAGLVIVNHTEVPLQLVSGRAIPPSHRHDAFVVDIHPAVGTAPALTRFLDRAHRPHVSRLAPDGDEYAGLVVGRRALHRALLKHKGQDEGGLSGREHGQIDEDESGDEDEDDDDEDADPFEGAGGAGDDKGEGQGEGERGGHQRAASTASTEGAGALTPGDARMPLRSSHNNLAGDVATVHPESLGFLASVREASGSRPGTSIMLPVDSEDCKLLFRRRAAREWSSPVDVLSAEGGGTKRLLSMPSAPGETPVWAWYTVRKRHLVPTGEAWTVVELWPPMVLANCTSAPFLCRLRLEERWEALQYALESARDADGTRQREWPGLLPGSGSSHTTGQLARHGSASGSTAMDVSDTRAAPDFPLGSTGTLRTGATSGPAKGGFLPELHGQSSAALNLDPREPGALHVSSESLALRLTLLHYEEAERDPLSWGLFRRVPIGPRQAVIVCARALPRFHGESFGPQTLHVSIRAPVTMQNTSEHTLWVMPVDVADGTWLADVPICLDPGATAYDFAQFADGDVVEVGVSVAVMLFDLVSGVDQQSTRLPVGTGPPSAVQLDWSPPLSLSRNGVNIMAVPVVRHSGATVRRDARGRNSQLLLGEGNWVLQLWSDVAIEAETGATLLCITNRVVVQNHTGHDLCVDVLASPAAVASHGYDFGRRRQGTDKERYPTHWSCEVASDCSKAVLSYLTEESVATYARFSLASSPLVPHSAWTLPVELPLMLPTNVRSVETALMHRLLLPTPRARAGWAGNGAADLIRCAVFERRGVVHVRLDVVVQAPIVLRNDTALPLLVSLPNCAAGVRIPPCTGIPFGWDVVTTPMEVNVSRLDTPDVAEMLERDRFVNVKSFGASAQLRGSAARVAPDLTPSWRPTAEPISHETNDRSANKNKGGPHSADGASDSADPDDGYMTDEADMDEDDEDAEDGLHHGGIAGVSALRRYSTPSRIMSRTSSAFGSVSAGLRSLRRGIQDAMLSRPKADRHVLVLGEQGMRPVSSSKRSLRVFEENVPRTALGESPGRAGFLVGVAPTHRSVHDDPLVAGVVSQQSKTSSVVWGAAIEQRIGVHEVQSLTLPATGAWAGSAPGEVQSRTPPDRLSGSGDLGDDGSDVERDGTQSAGEATLAIVQVLVHECAGMVVVDILPMHAGGDHSQRAVHVPRTVEDESDLVRAERKHDSNNLKLRVLVSELEASFRLEPRSSEMLTLTTTGFGFRMHRFVHAGAPTSVPELVGRPFPAGQLRLRRDYDVGVHWAQLDSFVPVPSVLWVLREGGVRPSLSLEWSRVDGGGATAAPYIRKVSLLTDASVVNVEEGVVRALTDSLIPLAVSVSAPSAPSRLRVRRRSPKLEPVSAAYYIETLVIGPMHAVVTLHSSVSALFVGLDATPLRFSGVSLRSVFATPSWLVQELTANYMADALLNTPALISSLEILGNPGGFVRSVMHGVRDLLAMPLTEIQQGFGPGSVIRGVAKGWASLLFHVTEGTLKSVSGFSGSVSRNLERLGGRYAGGPFSLVAYASRRLLGATGGSMVAMDVQAVRAPRKSVIRFNEMLMLDHKVLLPGERTVLVEECVLEVVDVDEEEGMRRVPIVVAVSTRGVHGFEECVVHGRAGAHFAHPFEAIVSVTDSLLKVGLVVLIVTRDGATRQVRLVFPGREERRRFVGMVLIGRRG